MKKANLLLIFIFCTFFIFQISLSANSNYNFNVIGAQIRSTGNAGIRFVCERDDIPSNNVKQYGILLAYGEIQNKEELVIGAIINNEKVANISFDSINETTYAVTIFDIPSSQYAIQISSRTYVINNENEVIYSDVILTRSLRDVAIKAYEDNDRSEFVQEIYNLFCVSNIVLNLNFALHTYQESTEVYSLTYSNPKYFYVTIVITLNELYFFDEFVKINYNEKYQSKDSEITIEENVLTFYFRDPYWTGIY